MDIPRKNNSTSDNEDNVDCENANASDETAPNLNSVPVDDVAPTLLEADGEDEELNKGDTFSNVRLENVLTENEKVENDNSGNCTIETDKVEYDDDINEKNECESKPSDDSTNNGFTKSDGKLAKRRKRKASETSLENETTQEKEQEKKQKTGDFDFFV